MIQPVHIKYNVCPDCGAPFKTFGREFHEWGDKLELRRHVNGGIWEYIVFACGRKDGFIPNFDRVETERPCENTEEQREFRKRRKQVMDDLKNHISGLAVDDTFRADLQRRLGVGY